MKLRSVFVSVAFVMFGASALATDDKPADKPTGQDGAMGDRDMNKMNKMTKMPKGAMNLEEWPADSRKVAEETIAKYGAPDEATATLLTWHNNGPWKHTYLSRESTKHMFPMAHPDVVEMVIDYKVPPEKFDELAAYDGSVNVDRTRGTMSARCDKEGANFLALNLADEIIRGKKTVAQARADYAKNITMSMSGEMPKLMTGLQFDMQKMAAAADPDKPATQAMGK